MKFRLNATFGTLTGAFLTAFFVSLCLLPRAVFADDPACATLVGTSGGDASQGFKVRDGEPVDLVSPAKTVHGALRVFGGDGAYRAYWQPEKSEEKYVLANAGDNAVRLVSTPPQGTPAKNGEPGTTLAPQRVLSCPTL